MTSEQLPRKTSQEHEHRSSAAPGSSDIRGGTSRVLKKDTKRSTLTKNINNFPTTSRKVLM